MTFLRAEDTQSLAPVPRPQVERERVTGTEAGLLIFDNLV